ncbi:MAG: hypothetical protein HYS27_14100 [Deltaproteobacteria bacterium]|nr:hypothetical protein [Deltaproteobacteria bacterium]
MTPWLLLASLALAVVGALAVIGFESPSRSAGGLITAVVGAAGALASVGVGLLPALVLWCGGTIAIFLLTSVVLINIDAEERGQRRMRLKPALLVPVLCLLWAALAGPLLEALPSVPLPPPSAADVTRAVVDELALPLSLALVALTVAFVTAVALVRRRT